MSYQDTVNEYIAEHGLPPGNGHTARARWLAANVEGLQHVAVPTLRSCLYRAQDQLDLEETQTEQETQDSNIGQLDTILADQKIIDELIARYTWLGDGLTQTQVLRWLVQTHDIEITKGQLRALLKRLGVTKDSVPYVDGRDTQESVELIRRRKEASVESKYRAGEAKHWRKLYEAERKKTFQIESMVERVVGKLPAHSTILAHPYPVYRHRVKKSQEAPYSAVILLSDWHIGVSWDHPALGVYNKLVARQRITKLLEEIEVFLRTYKKPLESVAICILGDMLDGVPGNMRAEQRSEQDIHGEDQIVEMVDQLSRCITAINAMVDCPVAVHSVAGNHDRSTTNRDGDPSRIFAQLAYMLCSQRLPEVEWTRHKGVSGHVDVMGTRVIMTHGDKSPRDLRRLINPYRDHQIDHYLVVSGHLHSVQADLTQDRDTILVRGGCLPGTDPYAAQQIGKGAAPMQVLIEVHEDGPRPLRVLRCQ